MWQGLFLCDVQARVWRKVSRKTACFCIHFDSIVLTRKYNSFVLIRSKSWRFDARKYGHQTPRIKFTVRHHTVGNSKLYSGQMNNRKKKCLFHRDMRKAVLAHNLRTGGEDMGFRLLFFLFGGGSWEDKMKTGVNEILFIPFYYIILEVRGLHGSPCIAFNVGSLLEPRRQHP